GVQTCALPILSFAEQAAPAAPLALQVPDAPGFEQKSPEAQSASLAQAVLQLVALAQTKPPGHAAGAPEPQALLVQVAGVSWPLLHEAEQSAAVLHCTQAPVAVSQTLPPVQSAV